MAATNLVCAEQSASTNVEELCVLSRRYCDLTYLTNSAAAQKELVGRALKCSLDAVQMNASNAEAHACLAVCYAKLCASADIKGELKYSRLFKQEAENAIALDPNQDIAYYLLGRWNYGIANVGRWSRALVKVVYGGLPPASNQAAIVYFKKAIALASNRIIYHLGLALAYSAIGERESEVSELRICARLQPTSPEDREARRDAQEKLAALDK